MIFIMIWEGKLTMTLMLCRSSDDEAVAVASSEGLLVRLN